MPEVEGLSILGGIDTLTGLTSGVSTVFEAKTEGVDRLTPLTDDDTPPYTPDNGYAAALGMTVDQALEVRRDTIWI